MANKKRSLTQHGDKITSSLKLEHNPDQVSVRLIFSHEDGRKGTVTFKTVDGVRKLKLFLKSASEILETEL